MKQDLTPPKVQDQFPPSDSINEPLNRWISWGLEPVETPIGQLGQTYDDGGWQYRLAKMPSAYRYTFSDGTKAVEALVISNVVVNLRLMRDPTPELYFVITLDHWSSNRSEQHFPKIDFEILSADGTRLALAGLETAQTFVSACEQMDHPGAPWQSPAVKITGPAKAYFETASSIRLLLPNSFGGKNANGQYDHGPICH